jgi:3-phosphoglycerate kinase
MRYHVVNQIAVTNQIVLLRIDGNVPRDDKGEIQNDYRLQAIRPTLDYLLAQNATVILLTHQGRPDLSKSLATQRALSNQNLLPWFNKHNHFPVFFEKIQEGLHAAQERQSSLILLENLRFFPEEKNQNQTWAEQFTKVASIYINDALSVVHRIDASVSLFPRLAQTKAIGFGLQKELQMLEQLTEKSAHPFVIILGGNKPDKLILIEKLLEKPNTERPEKIICGGLIGLYFLMAQNKIKKNSDHEAIVQAKQLLQRATEQQVTLILPIDHQYKNDAIIDIGPETIKLFSKEIIGAKTLFFNGTLGLYEDPAGAKGTAELLKNASHLNAFKVIGGGNAVDAVFHEKLENKFDWISTGGGATLAFLSAIDPFLELPGLAALIQKKE